MIFISSPIYLGVIYIITVLELCSGFIQKITITRNDNNNVTVTTDDIKNLPGFTYNNKVYSLLNGPCNSSEDCLSTSYSCQSETCQSAEYTKDGKLLSSKPPGVSAYWIHDKKGKNANQGVYAGLSGLLNVYVCRISIGSLDIPGKLVIGGNWNDCHSPVLGLESNEPAYEMLIGPDVQWTNATYHPDKAIYGGKAENGSPYLICRAICRVIHNFQDYLAARYVVGKLEYPHYNQCIFTDYSYVEATKDFDVLVHV